VRVGHFDLAVVLVAADAWQAPGIGRALATRAGNARDRRGRSARPSGSERQVQRQSRRP
jgi:hypothetical protein